MQLWIHCTFHGSSPWEFPHSDICGSRLICSSPQLFAACHVLHRLPVPRHSPYALVRLNFPSVQFSHSELLEFHKQIFLVVNSSVKRFYPFCFLNRLFHLSVKLYFTQIWKDLLIFANLLIKSLYCPLICSFLTLLFLIRFSMNMFYSLL